MMLIYKKIPQIMKAVGAITKDRSNTHQNYKFRGIEDMYNAFHPVFAEHGVFCAPEVISSQTSEIEGTNQNNQVKVSYRTLITMRHRFYAEDGSHVDVTTLGEGIDTSDKASNKAMSAAMKYAFIELFSIPTVDIDDSDLNSPEAGKTIKKNHMVGPAILPPVGNGNTEPTQYKITFGKWSQRSLEEVHANHGEKAIADYIEYLENECRKKNQKPSAVVQEFIDQASHFLAAVEASFARQQS